MVTNFKKKQNSNLAGKFWLHAAGIASLVILILLIVGSLRVYKKKQELAVEVANLKSQVSALQNQNSQLTTSISQSSDPQYIEKVAREDLDLQEPGETAVSFIMPPAPPQKSGASNQNALQSWWQWVISKF